MAHEVAPYGLHAELVHSISAASRSASAHGSTLAVRIPRQITADSAPESLFQ